MHHFEEIDSLKVFCDTCDFPQFVVAEVEISEIGELIQPSDFVDFVVTQLQAHQRPGH